MRKKGGTWNAKVLTEALGSPGKVKAHLNMTSLVSLEKQM